MIITFSGIYHVPRYGMVVFTITYVLYVMVKRIAGKMYDNPSNVVVGEYSILSQLNELRKNDELCDVTLKVGEQELRAHRIVLAAVSPYFKALLTSDFAESKQSTIEIHGFEPEIVDLVIGFAYTCRVTITRTNAFDLLTAADHFQILQVKEEVSYYLEKNISFMNCFDVFCVADMLSCEKLRKKCKSFILRNFEEVYKEERMLHLKCETLIELTSDDELIVEKEETVFEAVLKWLSFKKNDVEKCLPKVLKTVRLDILSSDFLLNTVANQPILKGCKIIQTQIRDICSYRLTSGRIPNDLATQSKHRKMVFNKSGLAMGVGKRSWFIASGKTIICHDFVFHQKSHELLPMTYIQNTPALAADGNYLLAVGSSANNNQGYYSQGFYYLEMYDVARKVWKHYETVPECCSSYYQPSLTFMMVAHKGILYVKVNIHNWLDIYNIRKRKWEKSSNMKSSQSSSNIGICYFDSCIYVFGGNNTDSECYNISSNCWEKIAHVSLTSPLEIAVKDGKIFAKNYSGVMFYDHYRNRWASYKLDSSDIYDPFSLSV